LLFVAVVADIATLVIRRLYIGDEDELHAHLDRSIVRTLREGPEPPEDPSQATDPADWFTRGDSHRLDGAPPPPSAEQHVEPDGAPRRR
jgi:hypothetical protein